MKAKRAYAIGQQYFPDMIKLGAVYVDKTALVYKLANSVGKYYFLSRPRRFGKSLLISTLEAYFQGRKELFKGLAVDGLETEWTAYPVIHIDLSMGKYYALERVHGILNNMLMWLEKEWHVDVVNPHGYGERLENIIKAAYQQTGRQVVVLVDEYDAPMLDSIDKPELQDQIRERVRDLFSPLKGLNSYLRFVFLTGISKFSQLSVFSELNNLNTITFHPDYESICGITEDELLTYMQPDVEQLAERMGLSFDDTVARLKLMYDGYHFSSKMTDIYNPWSLIYAFEAGEIRNYWFSTGTPTSLVNILRKRDLDLPELEELTAPLERFDAPTERITDPIPVLFQSGYLTLKEYDSDSERFKLGFPNQEVHRGFAGSLYKYYCEEYVGSRDLIYNAFIDLRRGNMTTEQFLGTLQKFFAGMPYSIANKNERHYQSLLYALLVSVGADVRAEVQTATGRMDMVLRLSDAIYIFEFKHNKTAEVALQQIKDNSYAVAFAADSRPVYEVGINFSSATRSLDQYLLEKL
ncbi:MAG: ATP-binding protein [Prevotella sp.]|nr:ATP-binding protein [Prevotella sp.]